MEVRMNPAKHTGHNVQVKESSDTWWYVNLLPDDKVINAFDYETGDGEGDYFIVCFDCNKAGPLPDDWEMEFG
jgi:hypothetical protein